METTYFRRTVRRTFRPSNHITILPLFMDYVPQTCCERKKIKKQEIG